MKVDNLFTPEAKQVLTEESLQAIENAFEQKLKLTVESALAQQDDLYAKKLQQLIKAIDKDHTAKLKRLVEAIDKNNSSKLVKVVKKYERALTQEAQGLKNTLVESISNYLEEFLDEAVPKQAIAEATKNNTARVVLSNLRNVLAVDSVLMKESIKDALEDGKTQIDTLKEKVSKLTKENNLIKENYLKTKASLVLESKIANLPEKKKEYMRRVLSDKSPQFIQENFDYTLRLFERKEQERIDVIKEEAFSNRKVKADAPVIEENVAPVSKKEFNPYLSELSRYK